MICISISNGAGSSRLAKLGSDDLTKTRTKRAGHVPYAL